MEEKREASWISKTFENSEPVRAWLALGAAIYSLFILTLCDSFGVYYDALVEKYDASRADVGMILSIRWIFIFVSAVFISPLIDLCGCRSVVMIFGFLYAATNALCSIAPTVGSLYFIYGVLTGVGDSGIVVGSISAVEQLFSTNLGFAIGFVNIGYSLGILIHPMHTRFFLDFYGVSGMYLMHGAISLHIMIVAFAFPNQKRDVSTKAKKLDPANSNSSSKSDDKTIQTSDGPHDSSSSVIKKDNCYILKTYLRKMMDFTLLKMFCFVLSIIQYTLLWMVRLGISSQIVSCATFRGIPPNRASYLISIFGSTGLSMILLSSIFMNMSWFNSAFFSGLAALSIATGAFVCAFSYSYVMFATSAILMGIGDGMATANLPLLVVYVVGVERFSRGFSLFWTLLVPSALGSSTFVGWMVDVHGNYIMAFIVLGVFGIISVILAVCVAIIQIRKYKVTDSVSPVTITTKL